MEVIIAEDAAEMGRIAAEDGATLIRAAIEKRGSANIIVATGASQFEVFAALTQMGDVDWSKVNGFHLDEYIGMPLSHPASFRGYLKERFVDKVPLAAFHYVDGEATDPMAECLRLGALIAQHPIDVAFVGIEESVVVAVEVEPIGDAVAVEVRVALVRIGQSVVVAVGVEVIGDSVPIGVRIGDSVPVGVGQ